MAVAAALVLTVAPAAHAAEPRLDLTASAPAKTYDLGWYVPITLTARNPGTTAVSGFPVTASSTAGCRFALDGDDWPGLRDGSVSVEAGATRDFSLRAVFSRGSGDCPITFSSAVGTATATVKLPVIPVGTVQGVLFGDRNGNGAPDSGEALAGVRVAVIDAYHDRRAVRTDAEGRYRAEGVPQGHIEVAPEELPDGWVIDGGDDHRLGDNLTLDLPARRPLSDKLVVTGKFGKDTYQPGETAELTFTLSNRSDEPFSRIGPICDRIGQSPDHVDTSKWDAFKYGVDLAPGETKTFTVTSTVPAKSPQYGVVRASCDFTPGNYDRVGNPHADLYAHVPGGKRDLSGLFFHNENGNWEVDPGEAKAGVRADLVDKVTGETIAVTQTNAEGRFLIADVPFGSYTLRPSGPWRLSRSQSTLTVCGGDGPCGGERSIEIEPAPPLR
ncbi:hypothetical protein D5S17_28605 [Pseudonocardiaceae bacterium YIM PH 21723]|nr:hypothetical protein D5S17_28605 [Pseudonocardiaceae bacterium YIM PH 21723]